MVILSVLLSASLETQRLVAVGPRAVESITVKNVPARLSAVDIQLRMLQLPDWTTDGESLFYTHTFDGFVEAVAFVDRLVAPAEQLGHHPDVAISYNRVSLTVTTHDAQGLTALDFQLAQKISQL